MSDDLVKRLLALSRAEHTDLSIGDEAADAIERLTRERDEAGCILATYMAGVAQEVDRLKAAGVEDAVRFGLSVGIGRLIAQRDEARALLDRRRMCVNCGKWAPPGHDRSEPLPECVDPDGLSACTFDLTPEEAWQYWNRQYYEVCRERDEAYKKGAEDMRELAAALVKMVDQIEGGNNE